MISVDVTLITTYHINGYKKDCEISCVPNITLFVLVRDHC